VVKGDAVRGGYEAWALQSTGERVAVALALNRADWLAKIDYTLAEAIDRLDSDWLACVFVMKDKTVMTDLLYLDSNATVANCQVLSCEPTPNGFAVVLDKTIFHFQGGGQPSDKGTVNGIPITKVLKNEDKILHFVEKEIALGGAEIKIDAETRALHSRLHSAGHLIGKAIEKVGYTPTKAHHWPGECKIQCKPNSHETKELDIHFLEKQVNEIVSSSLPLKISTSDGVRTACFGGNEGYPCGGTHVENTQMIGNIKIVSIKTKGGISSIKYDID